MRSDWETRNGILKVVGSQEGKSALAALICSVIQTSRCSKCTELLYPHCVLSVHFSVLEQVRLSQLARTVNLSIPLNNPCNSPPANALPSLLLRLLNLILTLLERTIPTYSSQSTELTKTPLSRVIPILSIAHLRDQIALSILDKVLASFRALVHELPQTVCFLQAESERFERSDRLLLFLAVEQEEFARVFGFGEREGEV